MIGGLLPRADLPLAVLRSKRREHNQGIHEAFRRVLKSRWKAADDCKAETLPKLYCSLICTDDEIELHRPKARVLGMFFGMEAHRSGNTTAPSVGICHVTAVADMRTTATLIHAQVVGAEDVSIFLSNKNLIARREPIGDRFITSDVSRNGVGLAGTENRLYNAPNLIGITTVS